MSAVAEEPAMFASTAVVTAPAVPVLIERLAALPESGWVDAGSLPAFLAQPGDAVLFVWTNPARYPECTDVAVVLPELRSALGGGASPRFRIGVVTAEAENEIADRYGVMRRPSLVFLRDGQYVATIPGMCDWDDFLRDAAAALVAPPTRPLRILR